MGRGKRRRLDQLSGRGGNRGQFSQGRSINCRHTPENLRDITESRVNPVRAIAAAIGQVKQPPRVWVQAGAVGFYGDGGDQWCDETAPNGRDPLAEVCRLWERLSRGGLASPSAAFCFASVWCWTAMAGSCLCWPI